MIDLSRDKIQIPARRGKAVRAQKGQIVAVINTHGRQVVDTWAFSAAEASEFMSMEHSRVSMMSVRPSVGSTLVTNLRRPILSVLEDTTPGVHDTLIAACDRYRYEQLGYNGLHDNCTDNLAAALREIGAKQTETPCPLNLFQNSPVLEGGRIEFRPSASEAGQYIALRAEMDVIMVFSACPQDMIPINGLDRTPKEAHVIIG
jgi:uncharacterized protein YcgI (DUF1989 family)